MQLQKAERKRVFLKIGLSGTSGSGKTYSALLMAYGITQDWTKIAIIDTENRSGSLYANLGAYNTLEIEAPFTPEKYIEAIQICYAAGMQVIIIDSITHEWAGVGGCLDMHQKLGGRWDHWSKIMPRHQKFIDAILQCPTHIITTVRRKQDYDYGKDESDKTIVQKIGTKEITREGFEYELTLSLELNVPYFLAKSSKDRTSLFASRPEFVITSDTGRELIEWAMQGKEQKSEPTKSKKEAAAGKGYPMYDISFYEDKSNIANMNYDSLIFAVKGFLQHYMNIKSIKQLSVFLASCNIPEDKTIEDLDISELRALANTMLDKWEEKKNEEK